MELYSYEQTLITALTNSIQHLRYSSDCAGLTETEYMNHLRIYWWLFFFLSSKTSSNMTCKQLHIFSQSIKKKAEQRDEKLNFSEGKVSTITSAKSCLFSLFSFSLKFASPLVVHATPCGGSMRHQVCLPRRLRATALQDLCMSTIVLFRSEQMNVHFGRSDWCEIEPASRTGYLWHRRK